MDARTLLFTAILSQASPQADDESRLATYRMSKPPREAAQCLASNMRQLQGAAYKATVSPLEKRAVGLVVSGPNAATVAMARLIPIDTHSMMRIRYSGRHFASLDAFLQGC